MKNEVAMLFAVNVQKNGSKAIAYNVLMALCPFGHLKKMNLKIITNA